MQIAPSRSRRPMLAIFALCTTSALAVLGLVFWKERMLFADAAHILFRLINYGSLQIQAERWGSFITQAPPLLAAKAGLPLKAVMMIYSGAFNGFYLLTVALLVFRHRRADLAAVFALYLILLTTETFYWTNNEVHQGVAWMFILLGEHSRGLQKARPVWLRMLVFAVLAALAIWTHPLVMLALAFVWAFLLFEAKSFTGKTFTERAILSVILLALATGKYAYSHEHGYDSGKLEAIDGLQFLAVPTAFSSKAADGFWHNTYRHYAGFSLLALMGLAALVRARRFWQLAATVLFGLGFFFVVAYIHPDFKPFYIESEWAPLTLAAAMPAVFYGLPWLGARYGSIVLAVVLAAQIIWIAQASAPFSDRLSVLEERRSQMQRAGVFKAVFPEPNDSTRAALRLHWGAPVETLMLSNLRGERPQRTFIFRRPEEEAAVLTEGNAVFVDAYRHIKAASLDARYFMLDTTRPYTRLP